jgi:DNA-binding MarR family transcriptional regulator
MSEYAVERARRMFEARQAAPDRPARRLAETPPAPRPDDPGDLIGTLQVMHARLRQLDGWLREEHRLNLTEMHVLSVIPSTPPARRASGRRTASARLARSVELSPSGLTRLVDRLAARGLVAKVVDTWDRRVTHLVLTEEGRAVRDAVLPRAVERIRVTCGAAGTPLALGWAAGPSTDGTP